METEKQFIEFVAHVFTLQWAIWAVPIALLLSLLVDKLVPTLVFSALAVIVHHIAIIAVPLALSGETGTLTEQLTTALQAIEPLSLVAEFVAYLFLIFVFSQTRQDMFRPGSTH